jgi:hypothetical protein
MKPPPMPLLTLPAAALAGPLQPRRIAPDDYAVEIDAAGQRLVVGRIMAAARAGGSTRWMWSVTGPAAPDAGIGLSGDAESRQEAQEAFRLAFDRVIAWAAVERPGGLPWHLPAQRVGG